VCNMTSIAGGKAEIGRSQTCAQVLTSGGIMQCDNNRGGGSLCERVTASGLHQEDPTLSPVPAGHHPCACMGTLLDWREAGRARWVVQPHGFV